MVILDKSSSRFLSISAIPCSWFINAVPVSKVSKRLLRWVPNDQWDGFYTKQCMSSACNAFYRTQWIVGGLAMIWFPKNIGENDPFSLYEVLHEYQYLEPGGNWRLPVRNSFTSQSNHNSTPPQTVALTTFRLPSGNFPILSDLEIVLAEQLQHLILRGIGLIDI